MIKQFRHSRVFVAWLLLIAVGGYAWHAGFAARLLGAVDIFLVWWVVLIAMGLSILYRTRTLPIARWLLGAYAAGAAALALTQALRGGV